MAAKSDNVLIKTALKKVNKAYDLEETLESLQDSRVYADVREPQSNDKKVVIVVSDFRKFSFSREELA